MKKIMERTVIFLTGIIFGVWYAEKVLEKPLWKAQGESIKFQALFQMMGVWMARKQRGKRIEEYFGKNGYKKVAIYGMSLAGQVLFSELIETDIQVLYAVDKNNEGVLSEIEVYSPEERLPEADVMVVSAITYYEEIIETLREKVNCPIISLEDIIYGL